MSCAFFQRSVRPCAKSSVTGAAINVPANEPRLQFIHKVSASVPETRPENTRVMVPTVAPTVTEVSAESPANRSACFGVCSVCRPPAKRLIRYERKSPSAVLPAARISDAGTTPSTEQYSSVAARRITGHTR